MTQGVKRTLSQFILESIAIHGTKYDYEKSVYERANSPIVITCPIHGDFTQKANSHLKGHGCWKCSCIERGVKRTFTKEFFSEKSTLVHGDKYDYSDVKYVDSRTNVSIICKKHGVFSQNPTNHMMGQGCPLCGRDFLASLYKSNTEDFIKKSILAHGSRYDYSLVSYVNNTTKVSIICPIHGVFLQSPQHHIDGCGCTECGNFLSSRKKDEWVEKSKNKLGVFYIIRCFNENEEFYKYGITFNTLKSRYCNKKRMPYEYEIIRLIISSDKEYIWDLEKRFGSIKKKSRYSPNIKFMGSFYECFK